MILIVPVPGNFLFFSFLRLITSDGKRRLNFFVKRIILLILCLCFAVFRPLVFEASFQKENKSSPWRQKHAHIDVMFKIFQTDLLCLLFIE